ncbi:MAG: hypothetical protein H0V74_05635 [Chloroflexi bacterium]|nr:hypothetical protein [Chloroflexota bacterium]
MASSPRPNQDRRTRRARGRAAPARRSSRWRWWGWLPAIVAIGLAVAGFLLLSRPSSDPVPWAKLGTQDVHSLAFGDDASRLLFGHHGGISESRDGGRTWTALAARDDAMGMAPATDGSIVVAGHEVFTASGDGGATWTSIQTDLPSLDIHGFARDPADPARMWAVLATGGLYESLDGGRTFAKVFGDDLVFPVAASAAGTTLLFAVSASGLVVSKDGGRTFAPLSSPKLFPIASLAATPDGETLVGGGPDGLWRSDDGGQSWRDLGFDPGAAAVAVSPERDVIAVVTRDTAFFRSDDGGATWPGP